MAYKVLVTTKTLIRVAFTILSLGGIAHADALPTPPNAGGHAPNFMAGGGG